jgi:hypothetical protein
MLRARSESRISDYVIQGIMEPHDLEQEGGHRPLFDGGLRAMWRAAAEAARLNATQPHADPSGRWQ